MTAYLLCELLKRKINVLFCDEKRYPFSQLLPLYGSHDTSLKYRNQILWSQEIKDQVWKEIITRKIRGQSAVLHKYDMPEEKLLLSYIPQIQPADLTNREGHAAKVYFNALFGMDFSRRGENVINAALNYGYSIILSAVSREIATCGYSMQIGVFHDNMYNCYNLASDLMEPFRPFVDNEIKGTEFSELDHDTKIKLINILNKQIYIDGRVRYMSAAIGVYVKSVFEALNLKDLSLLKFPVYEL